MRDPITKYALSKLNRSIFLRASPSNAPSLLLRQKTPKTYTDLVDNLFYTFSVAHMGLAERSKRLETPCDYRIKVNGDGTLSILKISFSESSVPKLSAGHYEDLLSFGVSKARFPWDDELMPSADLFIDWYDCQLPGPSLVRGPSLLRLN